MDPLNPESVEPGDYAVVGPRGITLTVEYVINHLRTAFSLQIEAIYTSETAMERTVVSNDTNRPGLILTGFTRCFANQRIQVFGRCEHAYLKGLDENGQMDQARQFFESSVPMCVFAHDLMPPTSFLNLCREYEVSVIRTPRPTSGFMQDLHKMLEESFAPQDSVHGVLVEVFGVGVLIRGAPGIGKSETAVELLERGHRLVADDIVLIRRTSYRTLDGSPQKTTQHLMELRGIGFINVKDLYGLGAVREKKQIEVVVDLEHSQLDDSQPEANRSGLEREFIKLVSVELPLVRLVVRPGRNIPILIEVIAMNHRARRLGYDALVELMDRQQLTED